MSKNFEPTKQINVHRAGTFENKIAAMISEDLAAIGRNGFGPLESILRHAFFGDNPINWADVANDIAKQHPERQGTIIKHFEDRGKNWKETI